MILRRLSLRNFRNFENRDFEFSEGINLITGDNGTGKTNLIEAIAYLSYPRSFRQVRDQELVRWGEDFFRIEGTLAGDGSEEKRVVFYAEGKKMLKSDGKTVQSIAEYMEGFITLNFVYENQKIVDGPPRSRRDAIDRLIASLDKLYLKKLLLLRKAVRQKNMLLKKEASYDQVHPWNLKIEEEGAYISERRRHYVSKLDELVRDFFREFTGLDVTMTYRESMKGSLDAHFEEERRRKLSLYGPHLDRVDFEIAGRSPRSCLSEGEKRMLLFAFYLASREIIKEEKGAEPVFVLDEPLSILGKRFSLNLLTEFKGQTFITAVEDVGGIEGHRIELWRE